MATEKVAGDDVDVDVDRYRPEDDEYLTDREATVDHLVVEP